MVMRLFLLVSGFVLSVLIACSDSNDSASDAGTHEDVDANYWGDGGSPCRGYFCKDNNIYYDDCKEPDELIEKCGDDTICREYGDIVECCILYDHKRCYSEESSSIWWFDDCGFAHEKFGECEYPSGICVNTDYNGYECRCNNHWEGENCDICPGNWDPEKTCNMCRGNWDEQQNCEACMSHWVDEDNDCGTCPEYWDPERACSECIPPWGGADCDKYCVRYADIDAPSGGDGKSWDRAFDNIQDAIDSAAQQMESGHSFRECEVWVAEGTYYIYQSSEEDTVQLNEELNVLGGFKGTESGRDERDWVTHPVILDGHNRANGGKRVHHVVKGATGAVFDGFVVTGGYASGGSLDDYGGGMYNHDSNYAVKNCLFTDNEAADRGGAIANIDSYLRIINSIFINNHADEGGAICNQTHSNTTFINCTFSGNTATAGGVVHNYLSGPAFYNSIIWGNAPDVYVNVQSSSIEFNYCLVEGLDDPGHSMDSDPLFADPSSGDVHILPGSPCIDEGSNAYAPELDFEGNPRVDIPDAGPAGLIVDIGAYEYQP